MFVLLYHKIKLKIRAYLVLFFTGKEFHKVGCNFKFFNSNYFKICKNVSVGDNCWFEAVTTYKGFNYCPEIKIEASCSFSDFVHLSAVRKIFIGEGSLIGSKVYIGDHSHGHTTSEDIERESIPANRPLSCVDDVIIGSKVWLCDGVVVLAGTHIADGSIVGANSVVNGQFDRPAVLAGAPAKVIRYLD